jgi:hypothetical protein
METMEKVQARAEARRRKHNWIGDAVLWLVVFGMLMLALKSWVLAGLFATILVAAGWGKGDGS